LLMYVCTGQSGFNDDENRGASRGSPGSRPSFFSKKYKININRY
jgi:hypothetical protein